MKHNYFNEDYVGKRVLVQTNEQFSDLIPATISGYRVTGTNGNIKLVIFKNDNGEEFFCGGMIFPDTPEFRAVLEFISSKFPDVKKKFEFLCEFKNFGKNMDYILDNSV